MPYHSTDSGASTETRVVPIGMRSAPLGVGLTLKDDRQALFVLGHHRRFPAAAPALVEQIGKRILIVTRVARESVDDRLVFFHGREVSSFRAMATTPAFANLTLVRIRSCSTS